MTHTSHKSPTKDLIKFYVPHHLKLQLHEMAASRHVAFSALVRLVVSEYVKVRT